MMRPFMSFGVAALAALSGCAVAPPEPIVVQMPAPAGRPASTLPAATAPTAAPASATSVAAQPATPAAAAPTRPTATGTPEDARRHVVRGAAAIEMAKSADDLAVAADEFRMATEIAPDMAVAWYNLGAVQAKTGQVREAMASYQRYLVLAPDAQDAQQVKDEIIKLEFRQERVAKEQASSGVWVEDDGTPYQMSVAGSRWHFASDLRPFDPDVDEYYGPGIGAVPFPSSAREQIGFNVDVRHDKLSGSWQRAETVIDMCTVPAETGDVQGEVLASEGRVTMSFTKARYKSFTAEPPILSFSTKKTCREVSVIERRTVNLVFRGPLPPGGIGAVVTTAHGMMGKTDWIGELRVVNVVSGWPAAQAGLRPGALLLAIDGVPVKSLTAGDAIRRLRGALDSEVVLTFLNEKDKTAQTARLQRRVVPAFTGKTNEPWVN